MTELPQPTLHPEIAEPVLAVGCAAGHGAQEHGVDFDDFFNGL